MMVYLRRYLARLLRLKNIVTFTIIVIVLYVIKAISHITVEPGSSMRELWIQRTALKKGPEYFVPTSLRKIDWHNYTKIKADQNRVGIGEQGRPASLPEKDSALEEKLYSENGFNGALSDLIPLNRSLPDIRHPKCKERFYIESLPTVSVVVPFHNEHWSTLLRTAYGVLHRSPEFLIKEVFLVDDASTKTFLKQDLDDYLAKHMPKVKVVRLAERSGLITARLAGAKLATADVLIFLDSHTEPNVNWLPPLLEPIALNYRTAVCPFIDVVAYDTFEYRAQDEGARGAFDWEFFYKRLPVLPKDEANMPEPFESPVMAGGLFAISRVFFWELGGYDPGLDIWGGEQYELSFKIWQCGGRMLDAPCSRVGHIYRKFAPFPNPNHGDFVGKNYRRVAEVWMDEYAQYLYKRRPQYLAIDPGNITEQKALRERLKCRPFRWFITQIAFDLPFKYPPIEPKPFAEGKIKSLTLLNWCIDAHHGGQSDVLKLKQCASEPSAEQDFVFSWHKDVKSKIRNMCWDLPESKPKSLIQLYPCHLGGGNQLWRYDMHTKQIKQGDGHRCVDFDRDTHTLYIMPCRREVETQRWSIDYVDHEAMSKWDTFRSKVTGPVEEY